MERQRIGEKWRGVRLREENEVMKKLHNNLVYYEVHIVGLQIVRIIVSTSDRKEKVLLNMFFFFFLFAVPVHSRAF